MAALAHRPVRPMASGWAATSPHDDALPYAAFRIKEKAMSRYIVAISLAIEGVALVFAFSLCRAASRADQWSTAHHAALQGWA